MNTNTFQIRELTPSELRQLQIDSIEILCEIDRICETYKIDYSIDGGTLLGAVRHKGFIPWDDDIDVIMTRKQYKRFRQACKKALNHDKFFLQDIYTDHNYRWRYAKMLRKDTVYLRPGRQEADKNNCIFIDIFILDNIPDFIISRYLYAGFNYCTRKILYSEVGKNVEKNKFFKNWYSLISNIPKKTVFNIQNFVWGYYDKKEGELLCHNGYPYQPKWGVPKELFEHYSYISFEGMNFKCVEDYDAYLTLVYGDYMTLPPKEKQIPHTPCTKIKLIELSLEDIKKEYKK